MGSLFVIRGLPGSGKTSFVKTVMAQMNGLTAHYEADQFPGIYEGGLFHPELLREAHEWCLNRALGALAVGYTCVFVSNTFSRRWEITPYYDGAVAKGHTVFILMAEGDYPNVHGVPEAKIDKMIDRWEAW